MALDAVTSGPIHQIVTGELSTIWRRIGVLIVHHDDNQRQLFHCGQVDCLMKRAGGGPAVADGGCTDRGNIPLKTSSDQGARYDRNERSQMADHGLISSTRIASMHIPVATSTQAGARSEMDAEDVDEWFAKGESAGLVADQRAKNIAGFQNHTEGGADRFLAFSEINAS